MSTQNQTTPFAPNPWAIAEATPLDGAEHVTRLNRDFQGGCHYAQYLEHAPGQPKTLVAAIGADEAYRYDLTELPDFTIPADIRESALGAHCAWDIDHSAVGEGGLLVIWDEATGQPTAYGVSGVGENIWFPGYDGTCPACDARTITDPTTLPLVDPRDAQYCPACVA